MFFVALIFTKIFTLNAATVDLSSKRSELIHLYAENLDKIWQISEQVPTDFYLSSLGISLYSGNNGNDLLLNKAAASLTYTAANASLLMASEQLKNQYNCDNTMEKYNKIYLSLSKKFGSDTKCVSKENDPMKKQVELGICQNRLLLCVKHFENYSATREVWSRKIKSFSQLSSASIESSPDVLMYYPSQFFPKIEIDCEANENFGTKNAKEEIKKACESVTQQRNFDNILLPPAKEIRKKVPGDPYNLTSITPMDGRACDHSVKHPPLPLIFYNLGNDADGRPCEDRIFIGLKNSSLRYQNIFLHTNLYRSFYWSEMAEEIYEKTKKMDPKSPKIQLDFIAGKSRCLSPILENRSCTNYAQKLVDSLKDRSYLSGQFNTYDIGSLGEAYNTKKKLTSTEMNALENLARDLEKNRNKTQALKNEVQSLSLKVRMDFDYGLERSSF